MLSLKNLTKDELVEKVSILLKGIVSNIPESELRFGMKATWNEDGMTIIVGIEDD